MRHPTAATEEEVVKENIYNIPNALSFLRILLMPVFVFLIAYSHSKYAFWLFIIAALTDAADGQIARRFNQKTRFGALFDPLSDRIFMIPVVLAVVIKLEAWLAFLVLTREVIGFIGIAYALLNKQSVFVPVRKIGKLMTFMQSVAIPAVILWYVSPIPALQFVMAGLVVITSIIGIFAGTAYVRDILAASKKKR
jgi:cardiolipin synthase